MKLKEQDENFFSDDLLLGVAQIIETAKNKVAIVLNVETTLMYWAIGKFINTNLKENNRAEYGNKIIATLSQQLTQKYGKGYSYSALTRMCKVADLLDEQHITSLAQKLSWSHLIELASINDNIKREFYMMMSIYSNWGIRELRTQIDKMLFERSNFAKLSPTQMQQHLQTFNQNAMLHPDLVFKNTYVLDFLNLPQFYSESDLEKALVSAMEAFIMELGNGFAFLERQKRISIDGEDYHLDLLFYHRKLKRLIAIDLKLGKFRPAYKGQMELYLRWLEKYEMQDGEQKPIGLLLCSEGNTEHIELLMLNETDIKVAQYITDLPDKQWFAEKLHRAVELAKLNDKTLNF